MDDELIIRPKKEAKSDPKQEAKVKQASPLPSALIYEIIRSEGEEELKRSNRSLVWSGIAAGMLISLSVLGEAIFRTYLPDTPDYGAPISVRTSSSFALLRPAIAHLGPSSRPA